MISRIDLHLHTDASDGAIPVEILVARAALAGLTDIAITEHDNVDSWERGRRAGRQYGLHLTPGIEISTSVDGQDVHLLGYEFSPESAILRGLVDHQHNLRMKRFRAIIIKLRDLGVRLNPSDIHTEKTSAPGRVHVAQALVAAGYVKDVEDAFRQYLRRGRPAYIAHETISPEEAIRIVHMAGGFVSLAHPIFSTGGEKLRNHLADTGLDAVEVLHPKHTPALQARLVEFCRHRGLLMTGGSDWHGTLNEPYDLGEWFLQGNGKSDRTTLSQILLNARPNRPRQRRAQPAPRHGRQSAAVQKR